MNKYKTIEWKENFIRSNIQSKRTSYGRIMRDNDPMFLLSIACLEGNIEQIKELVEKENFSNENLKASILWCTHNNKFEIVEILEEKLYKLDSNIYCTLAKFL